jgi:hypothetical protein
LKGTIAQVNVNYLRKSKIRRELKVEFCTYGEENGGIVWRYIVKSAAESRMHCTQAKLRTHREGGKEIMINLMREN